MESVDLIEKKYINTPLLKNKKNKIILLFKTSFTEFVELYAKAKNIAKPTLKGVGDNIIWGTNALSHILEDLVALSQEYVNKDDGELINEFTPSMLNDYILIFSKVEDAKFLLRTVCNLNSLIIQASSESQKNSRENFDNIISKVFDMSHDTIEKRISEIKQMVEEYISTIDSLTPDSATSNQDSSGELHENTINLSTTEENKISKNNSLDELSSSGEFDFSYLPGKQASLRENYKLLILRYFKEFPLWGTKRIKMGNPLTRSPIVNWCGAGFRVDGVMLWCDDSMVHDNYGGISGLIVDEDRFKCTCLRESYSAELSSLKSIDEKNGVISLNDGEYRFDFVMLNDEEYYFIYHLFERIVAFNKQNRERSYMT